MKVGRKSVITAQELLALLLISFTLLLFLQTGCTGQIPGSFRYVQQEQSFSSQQDINTKIDLLWVVDNSSSMDSQQDKLRKGFQGFASKYMKPTWDIRVAVITTDTYLAHPAFQSYLAKTVPTSVGYTSAYVFGRYSTFQNPSWNSTLFNSSGTLAGGIKYGELLPLWGSSYSRLLPGIHDGPLTALCFEGMPYFFKSVANCKVRDDQTLYNGPEHCVNPRLDLGETSLSQCVNTVQNDTVRSGNPIIVTMPPDGTAVDTAWTQKLVADFMVNASTGSSGQGSERGLSSVLQLLVDNETTNTAFFRKGSLRGIIFVSDEDDQSMVIPDSPPTGYGPNTGYGCDQSALVAVNGSGRITGTNGYCCNTLGNDCLYGDSGLSCSPKTVDGISYSLSVCADTSKLIPVSQVKQQLDTFFLALDSQSSTDPNYFIASIIPTAGTSILSLQAQRSVDALSTNVVISVEADRADRYLELGSLVGSNSLALDINESDYSPILDSIGQAIVQKKSTFTLSRSPSGQEEMIVKILHADGSETIVANSEYTISGKQIIFSNQDFVLSFSATDKIVINYQPKTAH